MTPTANTELGLSEKELRDALSSELELAFRTEGNAATIHAVAHSVARVIELDHMRIAEQFERAGIELERSPKPAARARRRAPDERAGASR